MKEFQPALLSQSVTDGCRASPPQIQIPSVDVPRPISACRTRTPAGGGQYQAVLVPPFTRRQFRFRD